MDKKERFYWDIVKGTAIFLMLWGHCIQFCSLDDVPYLYDVVFKTIYSFHMPVFMLVSGYLFFYSFEKRNLAELLEHRIRSMLQPIVMATFLNNVLMLIPLYFLTNRMDFLFGSLFRGVGNDLWFLWAVLYCSLLVGVCCKLTERAYLQIILVIFSAFVILLLPQWDMTLFMYPYFVAGFFCGKYRKQAVRLYRVVRYVMLLVFPYLLMLYRPRHYIYVTPMFSEELGFSASFNIALFRWAIGFAGSIWMLSIMDFLQSLGSRVSVVQVCLQKISLLGRNSLQIYCLSLSLLSGYLPHLYRKFTELVGGNLFAENTVLYDFLFTPVLAAIWAVLLYSVVLLLRKCKLHQLVFGR